MSEKEESQLEENKKIEQSEYETEYIKSNSTVSLEKSVVPICYGQQLDLMDENSKIQSHADIDVNRRTSGFGRISVGNELQILSFQQQKSKEFVSESYNEISDSLLQDASKLVKEYAIPAKKDFLTDSSVPSCCRDKITILTNKHIPSVDTIAFPDSSIIRDPTLIRDPSLIQNYSQKFANLDFINADIQTVKPILPFEKFPGELLRQETKLKELIKEETSLIMKEIFRDYPNEEKNIALYHPPSPCSCIQSLYLFKPEIFEKERNILKMLHESVLKPKGCSKLRENLAIPLICMKHISVAAIKEFVGKEILEEKYNQCILKSIFENWYKRK